MRGALSGSLKKQVKGDTESSPRVAIAAASALTPVVHGRMKKVSFMEGDIHSTESSPCVANAAASVLTHVVPSGPESLISGTSTRFKDGSMLRRELTNPQYWARVVESAVKNAFETFDEDMASNSNVKNRDDLSKERTGMRQVRDHPKVSNSMNF